MGARVKETGRFRKKLREGIEKTKRGRATFVLSAGKSCKQTQGAQFPQRVSTNFNGPQRTTTIFQQDSARRDRTLEIRALRTENTDHETENREQTTRDNRDTVRGGDH